MGLIKTAMMSGAAMYGVNQLSKSYQARQSNPPHSQRGYTDRDPDTYRARPLEFRDCDPRDQRYHDTREMQESEASRDGQQGQRFYLQDQPPFERPPYYTQTQHEERARYDDRPRYDYVPNTQSPYTSSRSPSGPGYQQGFVEPGEVMDGYPREARRGNADRADMVKMLAQQAMSMGLVGGKKGQKDQSSKGDLLAGLLGK